MPAAAAQAKAVAREGEEGERVQSHARNFALKWILTAELVQLSTRL